MSVVDPSVLFGFATVSAVGFAILFVSSWRLIGSLWPKFATFSRPVQADCVARVGSTVHAVILVPCLLYYLATVTFDDTYEPVPANPGFDTSARILQCAFAFSIGYFFTDGITTVWFAMPLWQAFVLHHILAAIPYIIFLWGPGKCHIGSYILASFLVVESTNITLNNQVMLERDGRSDTVIYASQLYTTLGLWLVTRIFIPCKMVFLIHTVIWPSLDASKKECLYFSVFCAWFIVVFCAYAFLFVLLPEVRQRWRASPEPGEVAHLEDSRGLKIDPNVPMSPDALAVTTNSPVHVSLYNARKGIHEMEGVVDKCMHPTAANNAGALRLDTASAPSTSAVAGGGGGEGTPRELNGSGNGFALSGLDSPTRDRVRADSTDSFGAGRGHRRRKE